MLSEQQQRIMGYFIEEAKDHLNTIEQGLLNLKGTIADPEMVNEVFRAAHSVKGGAAMLGLSSIQLTAHRLEDYFKVLKECPQVAVDQKLETLFLRVFDNLQALLEQLQGPFGLTDDKANAVMATAEPVFTELNQHLNGLVHQAGATPPEDVELVPVVATPSRSPVQEESALRLIFQSIVPAHLREMLQLFKQPDTAATREQLQSLCRTLGQPGEQLGLPKWCSLLDTARRAITNSDLTYRALAPVIIRDIKQAQDQVLAGQSDAITASEGLLAWVPQEPIAPADDLVDADLAALLTSLDLEPEQPLTSSSAAHLDLFAELPSVSEVEALSGAEALSETDDSDELDWFSSALTSGAAQPDGAIAPAQLDAIDFSELGLDDAAALENQTGPEVGITELNSLADLFEGELPDLGSSWPQEDRAEPIANGVAADSEAPGDFSDLLFDEENLDVLALDDDEDLSGLLNGSSTAASQNGGEATHTLLFEEPEPFETAFGRSSLADDSDQDQFENLDQLFSGLQSGLHIDQPPVETDTAAPVRSSPLEAEPLADPLAELDDLSAVFAHPEFTDAAIDTDDLWAVPHAETDDLWSTPDEEIDAADFTLEAEAQHDRPLSLEELDIEPFTLLSAEADPSERLPEGSSDDDAFVESAASADVPDWLSEAERDNPLPQDVSLDLGALDDAPGSDRDHASAFDKIIDERFDESAVDESPELAASDPADLDAFFAEPGDEELWASVAPDPELPDLLDNSLAFDRADDPEDTALESIFSLEPTPQTSAMADSLSAEPDRQESPIAAEFAAEEFAAGFEDGVDRQTTATDRQSSSEPPADANLTAMLDEETVTPSDAAVPTAPSPLVAPAIEDDFADLEALLEQPAVSIAPVVPVTEADDFGDLEALLQDADQSLGGSPAMSGRRTPAIVNRRPNRRTVLSDQTMRVSVKHLDNLNNLVGEMVVNRNSLEQAQERLRQFLDNLLYQVQQLNDVGQRMRDLYERSLLESSLLSNRRSYQLFNQSSFTTAQNSHATGASFDALEMDRFTGFHTLSQEMIELIVRVRESASDIDFVVEESDQVARNFRQITTQLQEGLTRSRMVPFAQTADRLPRGVRDNSLKYGKQSELVIEGRDTLIDKMIVELLYDPMTHLVNNAIAHGIETPEERIAAGKSPTGRITVRAFHQGNQTVISVSDDGAGIDIDAVRAKAIAKGLITALDARDMTRLDAYDLLFHHGFSTVDQVDDLRGRGVGLDVVRNNLNEIRGAITIDSTEGKGTTFTIRLPLTLSISKALCCISNRARIAFPMDGVEDMLDVPRERIQTDEEGRSCIQWREMLMPFQHLSDLLRYSRTLGRGSVYGGNQEEDVISIVVLRSAGNYLAVQVDQVLGEQEIVIKQLEGPVPKPVGVAGATVLGDGRIMPIADVLELIDLWQGRIRREAGNSLWDKGEPIEPVDTTAKTEPTVLIVDDSITVRELLSMTFNKIGYRVEQARDGQEAWEKLRSGLPCDLVFCDIEMPRMDGLELLSRIQKDPSLQTLPIAMLTSRGADRHRQMAIQLGAKGYFTKPYLEEVLLDAAQRMLKGEVLVTSS